MGGGKISKLRCCLFLSRDFVRKRRHFAPSMTSYCARIAQNIDTKKRSEDRKRFANFCSKGIDAHIALTAVPTWAISLA